MDDEPNEPDEILNPIEVQSSDAPLAEIIDSEEIDPVLATSDAAAALEESSTKPKAEPPLERVPIEAALAAGWEQVKKHFLLVMAVSLLYLSVMAVPIVVYFTITDLVTRNYFLLLCLIVCLSVVPHIYSLGHIKASLRFNRNEPFYSDDFVALAPMIFQFIVMQVCRAIIVVGAYCFFIIPGMVMQARFDFADFFIVDKRQSAFEAMASSWRITHNTTMMLIVFRITCEFVNTLGLIALVIGGIPARWMTSIAKAFVFDRLCQMSQVVPDSHESNGLVSTVLEPAPADVL